MSEKLSSWLLFTLSQFTKQKEISAYQMRKLLDKTPFECRYKNVHERVQTLFSLDLIKKVNRHFAEHGAIYYTLTGEGIDTLLTHDERDGAHYYINELIKNYGNDPLLQSCASPFFERTTLEQIKNERISSYFRHYFFECVVMIRDTIRNISYAKKRDFLSQEQIQSVIDSYEKSVGISVNDYLLRLVFSIVLLSLRKGTATNFEATRVHDLELLTNDRKFSLVLDKFKKIMTLRFDTLMKYSHSGRK